MRTYRYPALFTAGFFLLSTNNSNAQELTLEAQPTSQAINIDGIADAAWQQVKPMTVTLDELPYEPDNGYPGIKSTELEMRALYDQEYVYFLINYDDPTKSLERFPWVKQNDGSWIQKMNKDQTQHENTYYEDKVAILWEIGKNKGFKKKGCDASCHITEDGMINGVADTSAGRHFTKNPGETLDAWHWKSARTNANFQLDDQFFNADQKAQSKKWGRHSDHKTGGGYSNNKNGDGTLPAFMPKEYTSDQPYWITKANAVEFIDTFKPGTIIGGIVTEPFEGSRGDVSARGEWNDGRWTLEIKRKLVTNGEQSDTQDVQFNDLSKIYRFGITVFDNSQINHLYHKKSIAFSFQ